MKNQFLDFNDISQKISFVDFLNRMNIAYSEIRGELRGETSKFKFVVNIKKNLFMSTDIESVKGSVINFLSELNKISLRESALWLKTNFLEEKKAPKKGIPELELVYTQVLEQYGISEEIAKEYEAGLVKQKSIMRGRISFKVYDEDGKVEGYIGWHPEKKAWLFPKNFVRPVYNVRNIREDSDIIVTCSPFDCLRLIRMGYSGVCSLIAKSMTDKQEEVLSKYQKILLLHTEPDNIVGRLSKSSFVKAPVIRKSLNDYSDEEIEALLG